MSKIPTLKKPTKKTTTVKKPTVIKEKSTSKRLASPRKSPTRPTKAKIIVDEEEKNNFEDYISLNNLEDDLKLHGFTPLSSVVIDDNKIKFIKAHSNRGQTVYIYIDKEGYLNDIDDSIIYQENLNDVNNDISYSYKNGAYNSIGNLGTGIVFEYDCNNLYVIMRLNDEVDATEITYKNLNCDDSLLKNEIITYPIVKYSEILVDKDIITNNIDDITRNLRNASYQLLLNDLNDTVTTLDSIYNGIDSFLIEKDNYLNELNDMMIDLNDVNNDYIKYPPTNDNDIEKYQILQNKLLEVNDDMSLLLYSIKKITNYNKELMEYNENIRDVRAFLKSKMDDVNKI